MIYFQSIENPRANNAIEQFFGIECSSELKCVEVGFIKSVVIYQLIEKAFKYLLDIFFLFF